MNEPIKLIGCIVIAVGWVALPFSLPHWFETEYDAITKIVIFLVVMEIIFFTWVLYCKF